MKYYVCYQKTDKLIWGIGNTKLEAREDAKEIINDNFGNNNFDRPNFNTDLTTVECTKELLDKVQENRSEYIDWKMDGKKAVLVEDFLESDLIDFSLRERFNISLEKIAESSQIGSYDIYLNQVAVIKALMDLKKHLNCQ